MMNSFLFLFLILFNNSWSQDCNQKNSGNSQLGAMEKLVYEVQSKVCFESERYSPKDCPNKSTCSQSIIDQLDSLDTNKDIVRQLFRNDLAQAYMDDQLGEKLAKMHKMQKLIKLSEKIGVEIPSSCAGNMFELDGRKENEDFDKICNKSKFIDMFNKSLGIEDDAGSFNFGGYADSDFSEDFEKIQNCVNDPSHQIKNRSMLKRKLEAGHLCTVADPILEFDDPKLKSTLYDDFGLFMSNRNNPSRTLNSFRKVYAKKLLEKNCPVAIKAQAFCEEISSVYRGDNNDQLAKKKLDLQMMSSIDEDLNDLYIKYIMINGANDTNKMLGPKSFLILLDSARCEVLESRIQESKKPSDVNQAISSLKDHGVFLPSDSEYMGIPIGDHNKKTAVTNESTAEDKVESKVEDTTVKTSTTTNPVKSPAIVNGPTPFPATFNNPIAPSHNTAENPVANHFNTEAEKFSGKINNDSVVASNSKSNNIVEPSSKESDSLKANKDDSDDKDKKIAELNAKIEMLSDKMNKPASKSSAIEGTAKVGAPVVGAEKNILFGNPQNGLSSFNNNLNTDLPHVNEIPSGQNLSGGKTFSQPLGHNNVTGVSNSKSAIVLTKVDAITPEIANEMIKEGKSIYIEEEGVIKEIVFATKDGKAVLDEKGMPVILSKIVKGKAGEKINDKNERLPSSITNVSDLLRDQDEKLKRVRAERQKLMELTKQIQRNK